MDSLGWSNAEQVLYATVLIEVRGPEGLSKGTGFFSRFRMPNGNNAVVLVSCRHLLEGAAAVRFWMNIEGENGGPSGKFVDVNYAGIHSLTVHPDPQVDLAGFVVHHIEQRFSADQRGKLFFLPLPESLIPDERQWDDIGVADDVYVIGCPEGLLDEIYRTPMVRKGIIASYHKTVDRPFLFIDVPTFAGSSGSPVIVDSFYSFDRQAGQYEFRNRFYLVGVVTSGFAVETENGTTDLHLGKVIKSDQLPALYHAILRSHGVVVG